MKQYPLIVFSDFDGTITEHETLEAFIQLFIKEDIRKVAAQMIQSGYSVKDGIKEMMSRISVEQYNKKRDFFRNLPIRPGFAEFVKFLQLKNIPLVVLSGGILEMVTLNLAPYMEGIMCYYTANVDLSGQMVRFWSDYETEQELVGKQEIMSSFNYDKAICIGDSYTDFRMTMCADIVFARDRLAEKMEESQRTYFKYDTFYDIISQLEVVLEE